MHALIPPWTLCRRLLSIEVNVHPRTGESSHQLEPSNRQKFDLHRLCEETMRREEERVRQILNRDSIETDEQQQQQQHQQQQQQQKEQQKENEQISTVSTIPRPLSCLFNVAHAYSTFLQLEMLSSQAEALRRGAWSTSALSDELGGRTPSNFNIDDGGITVSPIHYFENDKDLSNRWPSQSTPTSAMAIHFWSCDDRHGTPRIGDLTMSTYQNESNNDNRQRDLDITSIASSVTQIRTGSRNISNYLPNSDTRGSNRLSLCFRSVPQRGIVVSISGGVNVMDILQNSMETEESKENANDLHLRRNVEKLLSSVMDPFQLSSSHALLYATVTCAHLRCMSLVQALLSCKSKTSQSSINDAGSNILPPWIHLSVDCGTISVSIQISYENETHNQNQSELRPPFEAFRLACDSRTGNFVTLFHPETSLLRSLVCNDPSASEIQQYRSALLSPSQSSRNSRRVSNYDTSLSMSRSNKELTGRVVRGMFESLSRSLNILGRRVGVGGDWNDEQDGEKLRKRAIENDCVDVQVSLISCCGIAAIFGTVSKALAIVTGTDAVADLAGGVIEEIPNALPVPPVCIILNQEIVNKAETNGEDIPRDVSYLQRDLFAVGGSACYEKLSIHCFDVRTRTESPSSVPNRFECIPVPLSVPERSIQREEISCRKSGKVFEDSSTKDKNHRHLIDEVFYLVSILDGSGVL